jgi:hypothetical protein
MAPSRPLVQPEQLGLVLICAAVIGLGLYAAIRLFVA